MTHAQIQKTIGLGAAILFAAFLLACFVGCKAERPAPVAVSAQAPAVDPWSCGDLAHLDCSKVPVNMCGNDRLVDVLESNPGIKPIMGMYLIRIAGTTHIEVCRPEYKG